MPIAIKTIEFFSAASGLCLNLKKCELFALKESDTSQVCNIPIKDKITYLGITIMKNEEERCSVKFNLIKDKTKKKLIQWLQRDLSLKSRERQKVYLVLRMQQSPCLLTKSFVIPLINYFSILSGKTRCIM